MASVGDTLPQPEQGWRRYDDNYKDILYSEKYKKMSILTCYGGACSYVDNVPHDETSINFAFIGTKIRIICVNYIDRSDIVDIDIDGVVEQFSTKENIANTSKIDYEKLNLENKIHNVKISVNRNSMVHLLFDCVDIDEDGYILSPIEGILTQKNSIEDMEIGDIISCKYTATTAGKIGEFSELGVCNCEEISRDVSSPTPNGKFFFIKVDDNKLIADRNIQNNISWNEINKSDIDFFYREKVFPIEICESDETEEYLLKASSVYNERYAYKAFGSKLGWHSSSKVYPHILQVTFKTQLQRINSYKFHFGNSEQFPQSATEWTIEGSNDETTWIILHNVKESIAPKHDQIKNYTFKNENFYKHYRIKITNSNSVDKSVAIKCLDFFCKNFSICLPDGGVAYNDDITTSFPTKALKSNEGDDYIIKESGALNAKYFAYFAFNKTTINEDDCWHSPLDNNPYITISSKKDKIISSGFRLTNRNCPSSIMPPANCIVYGSNDNKTFEKIYETSNFPTTNSAISYHYFNSQVEYLCYIFSFIGVGTSVAIGELEIFKEYDYKDSSPSPINKNQGGWPISNDWDKYVWKNDLNGKIEPGDNNIWNYKNIASICKNVSLLSLVDVNGIRPSGTSIVLRGCTDKYINDRSPKRYGIVNTNFLASNSGFRPMLVIGGDV